jgi:flagellar protein FlaI
MSFNQCEDCEQNRYLENNKCSECGENQDNPQYGEDNISLLHLVRQGIISPRIASYLWLCLEKGKSILVVGSVGTSTASTTYAMSNYVGQDSMNSFEEIKADNSDRDIADDIVRIASSEDTDYIKFRECLSYDRLSYLPYALTQGCGVIASAQPSSLDYFVERMDERNRKFYIPNFDVVLTHGLVGDDRLPRVTRVSEVQEYDKQEDVKFSAPFVYQEESDSYENYDSSIILNNISDNNDIEEVYEELDFRTRVVKKLIDNNVLNSYEAYETMKNIE